MHELLAEVGLALPRSPFRSVLSMRAYRLLLSLRGHGFRERRESEIPARELLRLDTCEAVGSIVAVDPNMARNFRTKCLWYALRAGEPRRIARALGGMALTL